MILDVEPYQRASTLILDAFETYLNEFQSITLKARDRFIQKNWQEGRNDALKRLDLYSLTVRKTVEDMRGAMGPLLKKDRIGKEMKQAYASMVAQRDDSELAETFFNSVTRKIFSIVGMIPDIEFTTPDFKIPMIQERQCFICRSHLLPENRFSFQNTFEKILCAYKDELELQHLEQDAKTIARVVETHLESTYKTQRMEYVEVIESVFYRQKAAYIIGRIRSSSHIVPLIIAFLNDNKGVRADAVLLTERSASIIFGFTRSYFHVMVTKPSEMINFLKSIIPNKRVSELYTAIGFHKHGKSELFRELTRSLEKTQDRFEIAQGEKGMVMLVFTLPSFDVVFKIIKDRFEYPKTTHRQAVRDSYRLVFIHNRAGRLIDAQAFEYLEFDRNRFSEEVLAEFRETAQETVFISDDLVTIRHLYTERRLRPLDLYIKEEDETHAMKAIIDYGRAIKELAACNIFTGDLFLKNFGVTRHGRVVFYDYDELCLLTDCHFRKIPKSRGYDDEMASEPWYFVGDKDIFPEEFRTFLRIPPNLKQAFEKAHGDLFDVTFWKELQNRISAGEVMHIFPYKQGKRFINIDM
ncbi:MAG: bifunctional isocitrate dehydrogenase kinase/phosphatase [Proteobacteria bacterium]|nr:bifunctional isocitrate dehydrogenase kinase/phosphatase [Pseudomonadota bacterium]